MAKCKSCGQEIRIEMRTCPECLIEFEPKRMWQTYCNPDCRNIAFRKRRELKENPEGIDHSSHSRQKTVDRFVENELRKERQQSGKTYEEEAAEAFSEFDS